VIGFTDALSFHFAISTLSFFTLAAKLTAEDYGSLSRSRHSPQALRTAAIMASGCLSTALDEPCGGSQIGALPALAHLGPV
jgi:hypothetical protein